MTTVKRFLWLLGIGAVLLAGYQLTLLGVPTSNVQAKFEIAEGGSLVESGAPDKSEFIPGKPVTAYGALVDTGTLNMLYIFTFDGTNVFSKRYYLKQRIYTLGGEGIWVKVTGRHSAVEEIDADSYKRVEDIDQQVEQARELACKWVEANRTLYNLNNYKRTNRYKVLGYSVFKNLNRLEFRPANQTVFIVADQALAGFECGKSVLGENAQRGDYLSYMSIYDWMNAQVIKVIIHNTGYFLE